MKSVAGILIFIFITFLSLPTILRLIEKKTDTCAFYNFEKEIEENLKEIKADLKQQFDYSFLNLKIIRNTLIIFENLSRHDNISQKINLPPPKLI
jgi:hypothetical protein